MSIGAVRPADVADAADCRAIYAPYVRDTAVTFEYEVPSVAEIARRIASAYSWLILERDQQVVGYAYASVLKSRPAFDWSCEVTIYLRPGLRRTGAGRTLYQALIGDLTAQGFRQAVAWVTVPNQPSEGLHRALGFEPVGVMSRIGWKLDAWHDVLITQRSLSG